MIRFFIYIILIQINSFVFAQKIEYGTYRSLNGSILKLSKNNSFYFKKQHIYHTDIIAIDLMGFSDGKFFQKKDFLVFKSQPYDSINSMIKVDEVINKDLHLDSINIRLRTNSDEIKTFICGTGLETRSSDDDYGGCFLLKVGDNKVKLFNSENFQFRIYPNIESAKFRTKYGNVNTFYFQSKNYSKIITSGLNVNIDFDTQNFLRIKFDEEIALIKGDIIRFLGEDFIKEE